MGIRLAPITSSSCLRKYNPAQVELAESVKKCLDSVLLWRKKLELLNFRVESSFTPRHILVFMLCDKDVLVGKRTAQRGLGL